jgi:inner membrane protein
MDNLCHTLVGGAMAEAGLTRRTRYATPALLIASNIPDLDVLVFLTDASAIAFRRGWTHGVVGQVCLPIALTGAFWIANALRRPPDGTPPLRTGWLLLLCYAGVYSHLLLDWLNTYGVRLLAPFDWRWFYGDAVFIIDPWLWLVFGLGWWLSRRRRRAGPARASLAVAVCYILAMVVSARVARGMVIEAYRQANGLEPRAVMVGPRPANPFAREVIVDAGDDYVSGNFTWLPPRVTFAPERIAKNDRRPEVAAATASARQIRDFLVWSRFPFWTMEKAPDGTRVSALDMRFRDAAGATGATFAGRTVIRR